MVFLTVGTQLPFERLVRVVDEWAGSSAGHDIFAQIGPSSYRPRNMQWADFLTADECRQHIAQASLVVAHAGMGSIITALEMGTPIIVMPRLAANGEHRNDHQVATAKWLSAQNRVTAAFDEHELAAKLCQHAAVEAGERIASHASPSLLAALRSFITAEEPAPARLPLRPARPSLLARFSRRRGSHVVNVPFDTCVPTH